MLEFSSDSATAFALGVVLAWLAGVRVYLTLFGVGVAAQLGWLDLPASLEMARSPLVIAVCALLALVEFVTDKMPGVDSIWDLLHTLVRIPAGAFLGAIALPADSGELGVAGMALGASVAALSHSLKSGNRALINTSPEPASNWTASVAEDGLVLAMLALVVSHPFWAMGLLLLVTCAAVCLLWMLWRVLRHISIRPHAAVT